MGKNTANGDILETRCHPENRGLFKFLEKRQHLRLIPESIMNSTVLIARACIQLPSVLGSGSIN